MQLDIIGCIWISFFAEKYSKNFKGILKWPAHAEAGFHQWAILCGPNLIFYNNLKQLPHNL